jgi:uncharacterized protein YabN with tetrapyrrole methylase and pyrophosphatase domain
LKGDGISQPAKSRIMQYPHVFSNKLKPDLLQTTVEWSNYKDEQKDKEKEKEKEKELCICLEYLLPPKR